MGEVLVIASEMHSFPSLSRGDEGAADRGQRRENQEWKEEFKGGRSCREKAA